MSPRTTWRPSDNVRSARMIGQSPMFNGGASAMSGGAASRMTVAGETDGGQSAGSLAGSASGAHGKAKPPSTGHHLLFGRGHAARAIARDRLIILAVGGVSAEKFLCKSREIEIAPRRAISPAFSGHRHALRGGAQLGCGDRARTFQILEGLIPRNWEPARRERRAGSWRGQSLLRRCGRVQTRSKVPSAFSKSCVKIGATKLGSSSLTER